MAIIPAAMAAFVNMVCVGTVYASTTVHEQLPRLLGIPEQLKFAPFGIACLGLAFGVALCGSMLYQAGSSVVVARGTGLWGVALVLIGFSLHYHSFVGILLGFTLGGVGVGLTYLAAVMLVGQIFPNHALARSAIGPLGFSSGAASVILASNFFEFDTLGTTCLAQLVIMGGLGCVTVGAGTLLLSTKIMPHPLQKQAPMQGKSFYSALLFFNALPGMSLFSALFPIVSYHAETFSMPFLASSMIALAAGGFFAPFLNAGLGSKNIFQILLLLRGACLIIMVQVNQPEIALLVFLTVLFAHGAGFSITPGLVKARSRPLSQFAYNYGQVLIFWGISGAVGSLLDALSVPNPGEKSMLYLVVGSVTLAAGFLLPVLSSSDFQVQIKD